MSAVKRTTHATSAVVSRAPTVRRMRRCVALGACLLAAATTAFVLLNSAKRWCSACSYVCKCHGQQLATATFRDANAPRTKSSSAMTMTTPSQAAQHQRAIATAFRQRMDDSEKASALRCLGVFDAALRNASVTYFLYGGSLLGARRHRGIVPWDDDIDVLANYTQLSELERALGSVSGYVLAAAHKNRYKFYAHDGAPIRGKAWRWPYVDVCFFEENATHVYDNFPGLSTAYSYAKVDVFPLAYRPFDGLSLPTPANEERVLARNYDERMCKSNLFSHRDESELSWSDVVSVPCAELYSMYPFIFRNGTTPPMDEILKVGDKVVGYFGTNERTAQLGLH